MITEPEIIDIAERFVRVQDLKGHRFELIGARKSKRLSAIWNVSFEVINPQGKLIDGPAVVVVNEDNGSVSFLGGP